MMATQIGHYATAAECDQAVHKTVRRPSNLVLTHDYCIGDDTGPHTQTWTIWI